MSERRDTLGEPNAAPSALQAPEHRTVDVDVKGSPRHQRTPILC